MPEFDSRWPWPDCVDRERHMIVNDGHVLHMSPESEEWGLLEMLLNASPCSVFVPELLRVYPKSLRRENLLKINLQTLHGMLMRMKVPLVFTYIYEPDEQPRRGRPGGKVIGARITFHRKIPDVPYSRRELERSLPFYDQARYDIHHPDGSVVHVKPATARIFEALLSAYPRPVHASVFEEYQNASNSLYCHLTALRQALRPLGIDIKLGWSGYTSDNLIRVFGLDRYLPKPEKMAA